MATITIFCNAFPKLVIPQIDITTFSFCGPTIGYDHSDSKSNSTIGFVAENAHEIVKQIQSTFRHNIEYYKPEDYIKVIDKFEDYEKDKRPRIVIKLESGCRGLTSPSSFNIRN